MKLIFAIILMFFLGFSLVYAIDNTILYAFGEVNGVNGEVSVIVNIYDDINCNNLIYTNSQTISAPDIYIIKLSFNSTYGIDYYKRVNIGSSQEVICENFRTGQGKINLNNVNTTQLDINYTAKNFTDTGYQINQTLSTKITDLNSSLKNSTNVLTDFTICNKILGGLGNFCLLNNYLDSSINTTINSVNQTSNIQALGFLTSSTLNLTYAPYNTTSILYTGVNQTLSDTITSVNSTNNLRSLLDNIYSAMNLTGFFYTLNSLFINQNITNYNDFSAKNLTTIFNIENQTYFKLNYTSTQIVNSSINFTQKNASFTNGADIVVNQSQRIWIGNISIRHNGTGLCINC